MNKIYDNGTMVLGCVRNIKTYLKENAEETWEIEDILQELETYSNDTIVVVNYDLPIGYNITYWNEDDFVKEYK